MSYVDTNQMKQAINIGAYLIGEFGIDITKDHGMFKYVCDKLEEDGWSVEVSLDMHSMPTEWTIYYKNGYTHKSMALAARYFMSVYILLEKDR